MKSLKNKIGKVYIQTELLKDIDFKVVSLIFSRFAPVKIEHEFNGMSIYTGYSPEFTECEDGTEIPRYDCLVCYADRFSDPTIEFKKYE